MKKRKIYKFLAIALSFAMLFSFTTGSTVAEGAKKLKFTKTGKKSVKSGQKRTLKISGTNAKKATWTVTGTGKQYIKLAKKKGKTNSFTVKANATGTAKLTAKLTKKNKVSVTYSLSCDVEKIVFTDNSNNVVLKAGDSAMLNISSAPSNAVCPDVSYEVVAVEDDVESSPVENTVTLTKEENGVRFSSSIPGTFKVTAKAGDLTATTKVIVANLIQSAEQTELKKIKAVFQGDIGKSDFKPEDFTLVNENGTPVDIKAVEKTGAQELSVSVGERLNYGDTYILTYENNTVSFKATVNYVSAIEIEPKTVMVKTPTDVKVSLKDAKGEIINTYKLGDSTIPENLSFTVKPAKGSVNENGQLILASLSDTAEAEAVYKEADGTEVNEKLSITAIPKEVELSFTPNAIGEEIATPINILVKDKQSGEEMGSYTYGSSTIPDYLKVTLTPPANGWAKPDEGLYLEKAGDSAGIHIEYDDDGVMGKLDGTITAREKTEEEKKQSESNNWIQFVPVVAKVSDLEIEPQMVKLKTPTDIKVSTKDAKGKVINTYKLGDSNIPKELSLIVYMNGLRINGPLVFEKLTDKAVAEAVYTAKDGTEIKETIKITPVPNDVVLEFSPNVIYENKATPISIIVKDKEAEGELKYIYGPSDDEDSKIPDYLKVTFKLPTNGRAKPDEGLYLANAGDSAEIHIEYNNIGVTGSIGDKTITATATPSPSVAPSVAPSVVPSASPSPTVSASATATATASATATA